MKMTAQTPRPIAGLSPTPLVRRIAFWAAAYPTFRSCRTALSCKAPYPVYVHICVLASARGVESKGSSSIMRVVMVAPTSPTSSFNGSSGNYVVADVGQDTSIGRRRGDSSENGVCGLRALEGHHTNGLPSPLSP